MSDKDKPKFGEMYPILNEIEQVKFHARKIAEFCKEHRCATCPFSKNDCCTFLRHSPYNWKGIEKNVEKF